MSRCFGPLALVLGLFAAGCTDRESPQAPSAPSGTALPSVEAAPTPAARADAARLEKLARQMALALGRDGFRSEMSRTLRASPVRERKVHFQHFLDAPAHRALPAMSAASGKPAGTIQAMARAAGPLEVYLPVDRHREVWTGGRDVLVATSLRDEDAPVAFDIRGRRMILDPETPPSRPVIALVPAETDFADGPARAKCTLDTCDGGGGGGGGDGGGGGGGGFPPPASPAPGLYLTRAHFVEDFEGWLRGDPELEIHILGQSGESDSLRTYQCAGEKANGPYQYEQNDLDWSGNVLLFSQSQITAYEWIHKGEHLRVFAVEDDDTACEIRVDPDEFTELVGSLPGVLKDFTGGKAEQSGLQRIWRAAPALLRLVRAVASILHSDDDLIGTAVEDVVAGEFHSGANWIVKGENSVTNGWMTLIMR